MKFDDLSPDDKKKVFGYTFIVRVLPEMSDDDIRGIFQRLNKNVVALNSQELRQATYWGPFIKTMQEISNYSYWSTTGIFTPLNIRRMMDIEYISELSIAVLHGHQNKKETLDKYYQDYEEEFDAREELIDTFQKVLYEMEQLYPDIKNTRWKKKSDFYSVFVLLATQKDVIPLDSQRRIEIRNILDTFASEVTRFLSTTEGQQGAISDDVREYAQSIRASSDIGNRKRRDIALKSVTKAIFERESTTLPQANILPLQAGLFEEGNDED